MGIEALNETGFDRRRQELHDGSDFADDKTDAATSGVAAFRQMVEVDGPRDRLRPGSSLYAPLLERTPLPMINILDSTYPSILDYSENIVLIAAAHRRTFGMHRLAKTQLGGVIHQRH